MNAVYAHHIYDCTESRRFLRNHIAEKLASIRKEPLPDSDLIEAVAPFSVGGGTAAAFVGAEINPETIGWVETFIPKSSGKNYVPHVTAGVANEDFVKSMKAEPFEAFTFRADGAAVYQLGNFGTAAKMLWQSLRMNEHDRLV